MKKYLRKHHFPNNICFLGFLILFLGLAEVCGQTSKGEGYLVDQRAHWVSVISNPGLIRLFVEEFYLSKGSEITKIEVFDLNNNGFSKGDVFKTYPDEEIYYLEDPSEKLQSVMNHWEFRANFSITGENIGTTPEFLKKIEINKAGNAIVASFLEGLICNYEDWPVEVWFHRDSTGLRFEMWGYNEDKLIYRPPPPVVTIPDTVTTYDMLHVFRADTLVIADTTLYDFMYIYKSVSDTVFVPRK